MLPRPVSEAKRASRLMSAALPATRSRTKSHERGPSFTGHPRGPVCGCDKTPRAQLRRSLQWAPSQATTLNPTKEQAHVVLADVDLPGAALGHRTADGAGARNRAQDRRRLG